ncbi:MAG: 4Fe-4S binding protein [Deltaproteobacteria bacterium]|nr:4Fe-4S binding protein [Deltaproteobacteria bacterium]
MKWTGPAEEAVSRAPFFVRKRVRRKVEEEAVRQGATEVRIEHVEASRKRFLENMEDEVKGYQVESCFGNGECPNRIRNDAELVGRIDELLASKELKSFLKDRVQGPLKLHHEFRVSVSGCPNACSRPQIVDVGILGARRPAIVTEDCDRCSECVETCREGALLLPEDARAPILDEDACLACGRCIEACPAGALVGRDIGYRVLVGGKLGRHPQLGIELEGVHPVSEVLEILDGCLEVYTSHCREGERFGEVLNREGMEVLVEKLRKKSEKMTLLT